MNRRLEKLITFVGQMLDLHAEDEPTVSEIVLAGELLTEREKNFELFLKYLNLYLFHQTALVNCWLKDCYETEYLMLITLIPEHKRIHLHVL